MTDRDRFGEQVGRKAARRLRVRGRPRSVWSWLGMLGVIGWSVALPTVLGVVLGRWLDRVAPAGFSWVISLLVVGLAVGILNAWFWVRRESSNREYSDRVSTDQESQAPADVATSPEEVNEDDQ